MTSFKRLSFVSAIAVVGFLSAHPQPANAAEAMSISTIGSPAPSLAIEAAYYYSHGRRYPYRYHGMYFNHRYSRGGRYHYY